MGNWGYNPTYRSYNSIYNDRRGPPCRKNPMLNMLLFGEWNLFFYQACSCNFMLFLFLCHAKNRTENLVFLFLAVIPKNHVWCIYLDLVDFCGKLYHTWILWVMITNKNNSVDVFLLSEN